MDATMTVEMGRTCGICGAWVPNYSTHLCGGSPPVTNIPGVSGYCTTHGYYYGLYCPSCQQETRTYQFTPPLRLAWTCPVCGNGCAPHADTCSHAKSEPAASPSLPSPQREPK
jgi:hypothetical protein